MIGRRAAATYELLSEDDLLDGAGGGPPPAVGAAEPAPESGARRAARDAGSCGHGRRTFAITLGAALVAGLAVWELLGLVVPSKERLAGAAPATLTTAAPALDGARLSPAPRSSPGLRSTAPRHPRASRARAVDHAASQSPIAAAPAPAPAVSPAPAPAITTPPMPAPAAVADREFGFER